jgi:hypothetical protein
VTEYYYADRANHGPSTTEILHYRAINLADNNTTVKQKYYTEHSPNNFFLIFYQIQTIPKAVLT